jgi:hypothetical protein
MDGWKRGNKERYSKKPHLIDIINWYIIRWEEGGDNKVYYKSFKFSEMNQFMEFVKELERKKKIGENVDIDVPTF